MKALHKLILWSGLLAAPAVIAQIPTHTVATTEDQEATGFADSRKAVRDIVTGRLYVAYRAKYKESGTTNYRIFVKYSDDAGSTWSLCNAGLPIDTEGSYKQRVPSIAIGPDSARTLHLVWYGLEPGNQENQREIKYSRSTDQCGTWSAARRITNDSGFDATTYSYWQEHPVVLAYGDFVYIAWEGRDGSTTNGGVRLIRSVDRGVTFEASQFVSRWSGYSFSRPAIVAIGPSATPTLWLVAFAYDASDASNPRKIYWTKSADAGVTWPDWARVCPSCSGDQRHVSMSRDTNGKAHIAWRENDASGYSQIFYAKSTTSSFGTPVQVAQASMYQFSPQVEVDQAKSNQVYVIWSQTSNAAGFPSEKPTDGYLYYATKADADLGFGAAQQLTSDGYATYPTWRRTAKTLDGNLDYVWTAYPNGSLSTIFNVDHSYLPR